MKDAAQAYIYVGQHRRAWETRDVGAASALHVAAGVVQ